MPEKTTETFECDFLIIGSGLAGLYSAWYASRFGKCIVATKQTIKESNSFWAQGGIAAAIDPEDSTVFHKEDTLVAGRGLCNREAVEILVEEGRDRVIELMELGMEFDTATNVCTTRSVSVSDPANRCFDIGYDLCCRVG